MSIQRDIFVIEQSASVTTQRVVNDDLQDVCAALKSGLPRLAGARLLITGGAGLNTPSRTRAAERPLHVRA